MTVRPQRPSKHRRWGTFALVAAVLAAVTWWLQAPDLPLPVDGPASFDRLLADAPPAAVPDSLLGNPLAVSANPAAEGMSGEQWNTLNDSLKDHPRRDSEIARVSAYMAFLSRLERYRTLRAGGAGELPLAQELARSLLEQLPERMARGEVAGAEARLLQAALLETLYPDDPAARSAQASAEQRRIEEAKPPEPDVSVLAERDARYKRQEAELLAAWNARPAAERRPRELESSLESLRRSVFDNPGSTSSNPSAGGSR